jgi:hypothetical protein
MPTRETYFDTLSRAVENLGRDFDIPVEVLERMNTKLATDEYYEKMKKDLGGEE